MLEFFYAIINFLILAALLWLFGRRAVADIFRTRRERIDAELDEAERIEAEQIVLPEIPQAFSDKLPFFCISAFFILPFYRISAFFQ